MSAKRQHRHDASKSEPGEGSERLCAVTRASHAADELIRFVLAPSGDIVPDLDRRLPGRGVWLTPSREIVEKAVQSKVFSRSLKMPATAAPDLADRVGRLLTVRVGNVLSLANKAGLVVTGFQQVESALEKAGVAVLVHGSDAAEDGKGKLYRKFKAIQSALGKPFPVVNALTIEEISLALGRPSVVHAALIPGGLSGRFLWEAERLSRYRASPVAADQDFFVTPFSEGKADIE